MGRDLGHLLDAVLDGMVVVDAREGVELLNAAACRLLRTSPEAAAGEPLAKLLGDAHPAVGLVRSVLGAGGSASAGEVALPGGPARETVVDLSVSPLFDADGVPDGAVVVLRDRTLQAGLRELAAERDRLAAFGGIATGIAHEVKNPLGGIRGAGELISARAADDRTRRAAGLIVREVDRITVLLDDLMVFGRAEELHLAPVNLHRILDDVLGLLAMDPARGGAAIERRFDPSIPELRADGDRLAQVFLNLARNALQAMEGRGVLTIGTRVGVDHRIGVDGTELPTVIVEVEDTGPGIPAELREKVALPFFTTRERGSGLGLALAQHWVALHGGSLRILSPTDGGTTVRVEIPLRKVE